MLEREREHSAPTATDGAPDDSSARALNAFVQAEFQAPVLALRSLIDSLIEDARGAGLDGYRDDLERIRLAGETLLRIVSTTLGSTLDSGAALSSKALRHDLRTPIASILGYGELIGEDAEEVGEARLQRPLKDVLDAAGALLREVDNLVAFAGSGPADAPSSGERDMMRSALAVVERLHTPNASPSRAGVIGRILIVDDNASMRDLLSRRLSREGHEVVECDGGERALEMLREEPFDLLLLDLMMPGLNGLDVMQRLTAGGGAPSVPVIVISALDEIDAAVRCIEAGADDYLSKPVNETLLRARIGSSLERKFLKDSEQDALSRLRREQDRSESLLRNVLPGPVVERLRAGETVIADHFDSLSVLFCDLVDFTALSARLSPAAILDLLNEIFSGFDHLADEFGVEKIKTIGDAYMAVGGLSAPVDGHADRLAGMALRMQDVVSAVAKLPNLSVRVGMHTGPAVAGIIGRERFFYDVWGDTVNTASRLESTSAPGRVHISDATRDALSDRFRTERREPMAIKGKGTMQTYLLAP